MPDLKPRELWAIAPLIALIIVLGVYPKPVLDIINPAVARTLVQVHSPDPVPPHPAPQAFIVTNQARHHIRSVRLPQAAARQLQAPLKQRSSA